jgi:hypothetical protein
VFNQDSDRATRLSADLLFGSGLRARVVTPNDTALPTSATLNLLLDQNIPVSASKATQVRFDAPNVTDNSYQLRTGTGGRAPRYGM